MFDEQRGKGVDSNLSEKPSNSNKFFEILLSDKIYFIVERFISDSDLIDTLRTKIIIVPHRIHILEIDRVLFNFW